MKLILFGTSACHLCEQADEILTEIIIHNPHIQLEQIDIAEQEQWQAKYALRIPVLLHPDSRKELGWPFDLIGVSKFIHELNRQERL